MNKLLTAFVVGFVIIGLTGCPPPPPLAPTFDLADGIYGYSIDLEALPAIVPILQPVGIEASDPANVIFYTLDGSTPVAWNPEDPTDPNYNMDGLATLSGSIPYIDMTDPECLAACAALPPEDQAACYATCPPDLTSFTSVGLLYFMAIDAGAPPEAAPATVTIKAIALETSFGQSSPVASATYTIDPATWNGDYTVTGNPAIDMPDPTPDIPEDAALWGLMNILTGPLGGGMGITRIDGDLTITGLFTTGEGANPLGLLYGCYPVWAPGCLTEITGDLVIKNNVGIETAEIDAMLAVVTVNGSVTNCSNADDGLCPEYSINLCDKSIDCNDPPPLTDPPTEWTCDEDGAAATVLYTPAAGVLGVFEVELSGTAPSTGADYTLVYYPDPYPGLGLICLGSATSDASTGEITIPRTATYIGQDLPLPTDSTPLGAAKMMLLPTADVTCQAYPGDPASTTNGWTCDALFGASDATDIFTYDFPPFGE